MDLKECPNCGCNTYYRKYTASGEVSLRFRFDDKEAENGDMYDGLTYKDKSKYVFCDNCHKKLFKVSELDN